MSIGAIVKGLNEYQAPKGRMNIIPGVNGSTVVDDTYNSSPDAARAALDSLRAIAGWRKIAALGDMMELGKYSVDEHKKIGTEAAAALGPNGILVTAGLRSRATAEEALKSGMPGDSVRPFASSEEAAVFLRSIVQSGDVILVKGSQSSRMERVSKALLREPEKSSLLLPRQEREWLEKK